METTDFAKHLTNFLTKYLVGERGASPNTICSYRDTFVQLIGKGRKARIVPLQNLSDSLKNAIFDPISSGFLEKLLFDL